MELNMPSVVFFLSAVVYLDACNAFEKRILLHETDIANEIAQLKFDVKTLKSENADLKRAFGSSGSSYIRWGRSECPSNGSEEVYRGYAGGSQYDHPGGGSNIICLPDHPTFAKYTDTADEWRGRVVGTEFETVESDSNKLFGYPTDDQDVPCVFCQSRRHVAMFPGRTNCFPGWTTEYTGYLMSGYYNHASNGDFVCVDAKPEFIAHGERDSNGNDHLLYFVESHCGALPCPPYVNGRELACIVCSL